MNTDGSGLRSITDLPAKLDGEKVTYEGGLTWSPDGESLAALGYTENENSNDGDEEEMVLYTMRADGSGVSRLANFSGSYAGSVSWRFRGQPRSQLLARGISGRLAHSAGGLDWSPDGELLVFLGFATGASDDEEGSFVINIVSADNSDPSPGSIRSQTTAGPLLSPLVWSPDSQNIAFLAPTTGGLKLFVMGRDGSGLREVVDLGARILPESGGAYAPERSSLAWSPDGSLILFAPYISSRGIEATYLANADGSRIHIIGGGAHSAWSPDGSRIASLHPSSPAPLRITAPDGSSLRVVIRSIRGNDSNRWSALEAIGAEQWRPPANTAACSAYVAVPHPEENPGLVRDCETLMELRDRLTGSTNLNWGADLPISDWEGVMLDDPASRDSARSLPLRVRGLSLPRRGLEGIIPAEMADLSELQVLDLSGNTLSGPIPLELGNLQHLITLDLSGNSLIGSIPRELADLATLESLDLRYNDLRGPIPPELGNLARLKALDLSYNVLRGPIPPELGNLARLKTLDLSYNALSGLIPPEMVGLASLQHLNIERVSLGGCVPAALPGIWVEASGLERCGQ